MSRAAVRDAITAIEPLDDHESRDRADALGVGRERAEIYRIRKPDTPAKHLVSYFVLVDPTAEQMLLVDHRNAGCWLPTGGHVEPDEDPRDTVRREADEQSGSRLCSWLTSGQPALRHRTVTAGVDHGHTDVSLWYVIAGRVGQPLQPDPGEFVAAERWPFDRVLGARRPIGPEPTLHHQAPRRPQLLTNPSRHVQARRWCFSGPRTGVERVRLEEVVGDEELLELLG